MQEKLRFKHYVFVFLFCLKNMYIGRNIGGGVQLRYKCMSIAALLIIVIKDKYNILHYRFRLKSKRITQAPIQLVSGAELLHEPRQPLIA